MDKRVETAARALARYRLGLESFISSLNPDVVAKVRRSAEDKLWPSLVGEANAMVEAIDTLERETNGRGSARAAPGEAVSQASGQSAGAKTLGQAPQDGCGPPTRADDGGAARSAAQQEPSLNAAVGEKAEESRVEQFPTTGAAPQDGRGPHTPPQREPPSAASGGVKPESQVEGVAAATPAPQDGRDGPTQVDNAGAVKVTPQRDPSFDPATEALRSALAALAATGTPPRGKA